MSATGKPKRMGKGPRPTHLLFALLLVISTVSFAYSWFTVYRREEAEIPSPIVHLLLKDLRAFHKVNNHFPEDLYELERKLREPQRRSPMQYAEGGHSFTYANYYYLYRQAGSDICTLWAAPLGRQRKTASAYFLTITKDSIETWKGAALDYEDFKKIRGLMKESELMELGLSKYMTGNEPQPSSAVKFSRRF